MANLTAAQIKSILETAVYPEEVEINAALMQNDERRKYPSIDVQNVTGEETVKGFPTKITGQRFLIHLFYRYRSFGEQHEPDIKALEDVIFDTIDANANFSIDTKITITQSWNRQSETFPVRRSHSILTVQTDDLESTTGEGIPGDEIEITFPNPLGSFKVINLTTDDRTNLKDTDRPDDGERIFTKINFQGLGVVELEFSVKILWDLRTGKVSDCRFQLCVIVILVSIEKFALASMVSNMTSSRALISGSCCSPKERYLYHK